MNIGPSSLGAAAQASSLYEVKLAKGQQDQQAKVVGELLSSTAQTAPSADPNVGRRVNITA